MRFIKAIGNWFKSRFCVNRVTIEAQLKPDVTLDEIMRSGGKYKLSPDDILVIHSKMKLSQKAIDNISRSLRLAFKKAWGYTPFILLFEEGMSYSVMKREHCKASTLDVRDLSTT